MKDKLNNFSCCRWPTVCLTTTTNRLKLYFAGSWDFPCMLKVWKCGSRVVTKMALEGDEVGLENLFVDTSDTTVTFPNCPDVATEFFKPQRTSTRKPQKSIDEKLQEHIDVADEYLLRAQGGVTVGTRSQFKLSFHFSQVGWYNPLTDTFN